nr:hypothetical protein [uncultured Tyzzerella sp.]
MDKKKKVILINGDKSNWYEQVIFIIKDNKENNVPKNLVLEAEKIINEYMSKKYNSTNIDKIPPNNIKKTYNVKNKKSLKFYNNILNVSIICTIAFICYLLYQIYI